MPAKYRLSRTDFTRMRGFKRVNGTLFSLSYGILPERDRPGAACVVSAKTIPRATGRNLVKRRTRAALLGFMKKATCPIVLVFHAKKPVKDATAKEVVLEIEALIKRAGSIS